MSLRRGGHQGDAGAHDQLGLWPPIRLAVPTRIVGVRAGLRGMRGVVGAARSGIGAVGRIPASLGGHSCGDTTPHNYSRPPTLSPSDTVNTVTATSPVLAPRPHVVPNHTTATTDYLGTTAAGCALPAGRKQQRCNYGKPIKMMAATMGNSVRPWHQVRNDSMTSCPPPSPLGGSHYGRREPVGLLSRVHQLSRVPIALIVPQPASSRITHLLDVRQASA
ncbi:hypothetical protein EDB89DRAFT_2246874 [Lactarius sanguifluus]|nr:hypothetical protein EDB89DRAFT_2246874 [Lactarius sanguifluus]